MVKKILFMLLFFPIILFASPKECAVKPSYNIIITEASVRLFNTKTNITISPQGKINLDGTQQVTDTQLQKTAALFQHDLRKQLPAFKQQAYSVLDNLKTVFDQAINAKLANDIELHKQLDKLYKRLANLLENTIVTEQGQTRFYYKKFNNIRAEGESITKGIFYNIIGNSILTFNLYKNYQGIKKIAKDEWKGQKPMLKQFDRDVCTLITTIDNNYQQIVSDVKSR